MINNYKVVQKHSKILLNHICTILFYNLSPLFRQLENPLFIKISSFIHKKVIKVLFDSVQRRELLAVQRILQWPEEMKIWVVHIWRICGLAQNIPAILDMSLSDIHCILGPNIVMIDDTSTIVQFCPLFFHFYFQNCHLETAFFWIYSLIWWQKFM